MANTKSAAKRARQTKRQALHNRSVRSRLRSMHKHIVTGGGNSDANQVRALVSAVDKAAKRGIIHRNAANRRKARLRKALSAKPA